VGCNYDLESARFFLLRLEWNFGFFRSLSSTHLTAIEIIFIHLEQRVVVIIGVVEHPLQTVPLFEHGAKNERPRGGRSLIQHKTSATVNEPTLVGFPPRHVVKVLHPTRCKRERTDGARFSSRHFQWNRARKVSHASCKLVVSRRDSQRSAAGNFRGDGISVF